MIFECETCHKQFTRLHSLKRHLPTHSKKSRKCEICKEKIGTKRHLRTHTGEKPFQCETCNTKFTQKSSLKAHLLMHTGEKPFKCNICNKKFARNSLLTKHLLTHTGDKPYTCEICNKKFTLKFSLKVHSLTHTGDQPFECELCNKKFAQKYNFQKHIQTHTNPHATRRPFKNKILKKISSQRKQSDLSDYLKQHTDDGESCNLKMYSENQIKLEDISGMSDTNDSIQTDIKLELSHEYIKIEEISSEIKSDFDDDKSFDLKLNSESKLNLQEDMSDVGLNDSMQPDIKLESLHKELDIKLEEFSSDED